MDRRYRENNQEKRKIKLHEYYDRNKQHILQKVDERRQRLRLENQNNLPDWSYYFP